MFTLKNSSSQSGCGLVLCPNPPYQVVLLFAATFPNIGLNSLTNLSAHVVTLTPPRLAGIYVPPPFFPPPGIVVTSGPVGVGGTLNFASYAGDGYADGILSNVDGGESTTQYFFVCLNNLNKFKFYVDIWGTVGP